MSYKILDKTNKFLNKNHNHMINGNWQNSSNDRILDVINPATKEVVSKVQLAGKDEVDLACKSARESFDKGIWKDMTPSNRGKILWKWADLLEERIDQIIEVEVIDNGMPVIVAKTFIGWAIDWIRYYSGMVDKVTGDNFSNVISGDNQRFHSYTSYEPVGAVGIIIPWNGPFGTFIIKVAPALAAGCSCVVKPAEDTPLNALIIAETAIEAGIPPGVLNVIIGDGSAGELLVKNSNLDKISFTGSTEVGKKIVNQCSNDLKRVTLELGGKSPCIIFNDANLDIAIPGAAMAIFSNSGQVCFAGSRLFIQEDIYDEAIRGIADFSKNLKVGNGFDEDTVLGPLISNSQHKKVSEYVDIGLKEGANIISGGSIDDDSGFFFNPTVFGRVSKDMRIAKEEIFGPVLAACPFSSIDEVVDLANDTRYGLGSGIFSNDINKVHNVANRIKAGNVWVNHYGGMHPTLPFGGYKESGWGRELGIDGFKTYLEQKTVSIKLD